MRREPFLCLSAQAVSYILSEWDECLLSWPQVRYHMKSLRYLSYSCHPPGAKTPLPHPAIGQILLSYLQFGDSTMTWAAHGGHTAIVAYLHERCNVDLMHINLVILSPVPVVDYHRIACVHGRGLCICLSSHAESDSSFISLVVLA